MNVKKLLDKFVTAFFIFISACVCRYIFKNNSSRIKSNREDIRRAKQANKGLSRREQKLDKDYRAAKQTIQEIRDREQNTED